jgi:hypothetical protein
MSLPDVAGPGPPFRRFFIRCRRVGVLASLLLMPGALTGQQVDPPPDSARAARQQAAADSARQRQLELLQDLARAPGADSARLAADSARLAGPEREGPRAPFVTAGDTILDQLILLEGYAPTQYSGVSAEYLASDGVLVLRGDSTTRASFLGTDGTRISSDSIIRYEEESGQMTPWGDIVSTPTEGDEVRSRYLACDLEDEECRALGARTQYTEGAEWYVTSDLPVIRSDLQYGHKARFTSCELEEPHYHFETDELKIVRGGILVAKPVRLYFADVPVAWLPFIAQSLSQGRSSGLLTPTFSVNDIVRTSGGYRRRVSNVGFYWAMNDYMDATFALDWFDDNYTAITGSYRYSWLRQFLRGGLNFRQFWRAEGGSELTLDTNASWELSERTAFRMSARYASSSAFVTRNSFNPAEVTQSIDSEGGFSHRFDWGSLAVNGNRRQFLSDDRVEMTFPSASLSLKTITLFPAPANRAGILNNMTWSGGARFSASSTDLAQLSGFYTPGQEDRSSLNGSVSSGISIGNLSLSGSGSYRRGLTLGIRDTLPTASIPQLVAERGMLAFSTPEWRHLLALQTADSLFGPAQDVAVENLDWSASVNYQQRLIGSTTITPRVSISGGYLRSDLIPEASSTFVAGPARTSFGATLKSDLYGFFPGFAGFERIRHKITPSFTYDWSPEVMPTPLQVTVFGSRAVQPRNVVSVTLNQTFEAKRASAADTATAPIQREGAAFGEPRRLPQSEIVNLLSLRTSAVRYDFVEADSAGFFLAGFETLQLTNQISSDLLRGLTVSMTHDLFEDVSADSVAGVPRSREFKPKLTQMNLGFSLSNRSSIFRFLGFGRSNDEPDEEEEEDMDELLDDDIFGLEDDPLAFRRNDESSVIPTARPNMTARSGAADGVGEWSAQISYALNKPRTDTGIQSQMIQASLRLKPTAMWEMSWRTSYDLELGSFNDHAIRLSRDLHRWRANFDFLQTATGNWSFRFEVTLLDNQDLKFDYQQRNLDRAATLR